VRAIDADGKQIGVVPTSQALALAQQRGLDLVEVAPKANPPVCRIVDFGKYKYEQTKREREARKHQHATKLKEIKLRLNIDDHDYETKLNHMRGFLADGMKVKVSLFFRGRENAHPELGAKLMERVIVDVASSGKPEVTPRQIGRSMHMMIGPTRAPKAERSDHDEEFDDTDTSAS
jgi:translation initiation factor IF-3